jgi:hypothetical protein
MKTKLILGVLALLVILAGALFVQERGRGDAGDSSRAAEVVAPAVPQPTATPRVPAYSAVEPDAKSLGPLLPAEQFFGAARDGYAKAKEIPQTLAQLPCYCHCDQHMGHKSLHTCFETEHAANCSICLNEALLAYDMQKKRGMSPSQIRQAIINQYSAMQMQ